MEVTVTKIWIVTLVTTATRVNYLGILNASPILHHTKLLTAWLTIITNPVLLIVIVVILELIVTAILLDNANNQHLEVLYALIHQDFPNLFFNLLLNLQIALQLLSNRFLILLQLQALFLHLLL